jgi:hypothetical protein
VYRANRFELLIRPPACLQIRDQGFRPSGTHGQRHDAEQRQGQSPARPVRRAFGRGLPAVESPNLCVERAFSTWKWGYFGTIAHFQALTGALHFSPGLWPTVQLFKVYFIEYIFLIILLPENQIYIIKILLSWQELITKCTPNAFSP